MIVMSAQKGEKKEKEKHGGREHCAQFQCQTQEKTLTEEKER